MPTFVDLFSGSGGLTLGFEQAGFTNLFSVDVDPIFNKTYRRNFPTHKLIEKDISLLEEDEIIDVLNGQRVDVVVGGPPCQGFSMAGTIGRRFIDDPRNHLFQEFARVVDIIKPAYFVMENVARLYTHNKGQTRLEIISKFEELGYKVDVRVLNTVDYGVPQKRSRVIFIGSRVGGKITFPIPDQEHKPTVEDAIGDLPPLKSGEVSVVPNHIAMKHSEQMLKKMSFVKDGGNRSEIPDELRPLSGDIRKYIRYNSKQPSICVTGDMRKVFHYRDNRALTVRELARLQTYPDDFIFEGPFISQQQQVGNSVPPLLGLHLAKNIENMMSSALVHG